MRLSGFFSTYSAGDPEVRKTSISLLSTMIVVALLALPVMLIFRLSNEFRLYTADIVLLVLIPIFFLLYLLLKRGMLILVSVLFFTIAWVAMTVMAVKGLGIRDVTVVGYILIVFIAVLFTGYRVAIILTLSTIISVWIMAIAEERNFLIPPSEPPLIYARDFTIVIFLVLTGIMLYERNYRYSFNRISEELAERKITEKKLAHNEQNLRLQNEELLSAKLKAEESDRLKTAFLQNISHEIRTPMNGIVGFAELLKDPGITSQKSEEYINLMMQCSDQLASVINDMIDVSKIEAGALELNISEFTSEALLDDIRILFDAAASEKGINLSIRNDLPGLNIRSDRGKITRILNNLVSNAVKFTSVGEVSVKVWQSEGNLIVKVTDEGIGIRSEETGKIFDRFRQAEVGLTRNYGGSGLGLAICKGNLDFLGGTVRVESEYGKGSCFTVTIPVEFFETILPEQKKYSVLDGTREIRILIAEDDEISFLYLKSILNKENLKIVRAQDGIEALSLFRAHSDFDLILMDLKLPEMSGFETTKIIKQENSSIPVIAISAYAFEEDKKRAAECGIDDYISKPVNKNDLIIKINKHLAGLS